MNNPPSSTSTAPHKIKETRVIIRGIDIEGRSTVNQYTLVKKLGEGAFGKVRLAQYGEKEDKSAIKILKKTALKKRREVIRDEKGRIKYKDAFENILREISIMKKINHPNVVRLKEVIDSPNSDKMYIVLDFADKGQMIEWDEEKQIFYPLHQKAFFEEEDLKRMFKQMVLGVESLHANGVVHRDLKPQNILEFKDGRVIIADLGVAAFVDAEGSDTQIKTEGTYHFMCPESLSKDGATPGYSGKAADVWALGITFFAYIYYKLPFNSEDVMELFDEIENKELQFPADRVISDQLKDVLNRMLEKNPKWRIKLDDLKNHSWMTSSTPSSSKLKEIENKQQAPQSV